MKDYGNTAYGKAAVIAVNFVTAEKTGMGPKDAWSEACRLVINHEPHICAKEAFLGLCEEGLIEGIPRGKYRSNGSDANKRYAIRMVELVDNDRSMISDNQELWNHATEGEAKIENGQRHIVQGLYRHNYLLLKTP